MNPDLAQGCSVFGHALERWGGEYECRVCGRVAFARTGPDVPFIYERWMSRFGGAA